MTNPLQFVLNGLHMTKSGLLSLRGEASDGKKQVIEEAVKNDNEVDGQGGESRLNAKHKACSFDHRKLRSNDHTVIDNSQLFNYENYTRIPDYRMPMDLIDNKVEEDNIKHKDSTMVNAVHSTELSLYVSPMEAPRLRPTSDPLGDELYVPHHKRMERQERRIQMIEKEKSAVELDRFMHQREALTGPNWKKDIMHITFIKDSHDEQELEWKRKLTLADIDLYLAKYKSWKSRQRTQSSQSATTPAEEIIPVSEDQKYTRKKTKEAENSSQDHAKRPPPTRTIRTPRTPPPPKPWVSFFHEGDATRPKFDQLTKREHRNVKAFGYDIPFMSLSEFQLPEDWKSQRERVL